ncbi:MAG: DMT family transporter [Anaerolineaceae bacterium]
MIEKIIVIVVGLIGGIAVGLQSPIAGNMGQRIGGTASSFIVHFSGMVLSGILLIFLGGENIREWRTLPWYMLIAGIFGVILYQAINFVLPRLGGTTMIMLIIIGQLTMGILVDHFGWFGVTPRPIDLTRGIGVAVLLLGGYLISK